MREVVHRCDVPVGRSGNPCGERVPNDEPTTFCLGDAMMEVDLCEKHIDELQKAMAKFIEVARPSEKQHAQRRNSTVRSVLRGKKGVFTQKDVREWLREQGRDVAPSGRLPNEFIEEYKAAQEADLV